MEKILIKEIYLPIIYIIIGLVVYKIAKRIIKKIFKINSGKKFIDKKKLVTLEQMLINILRGIIIILVVLSVLTVFGFNVKTALAGLGIVSLVLGLALQDVLKDFIVGFSLIVENYFSVGDTVEFNGFKGKVVYLGLRTTKIQEFQGPMLIVPNRNIVDVINYTNTYSKAIVDIDVSYESNYDKVEKVLNETAEKLNDKLPGLVDKIDVLGIENLGSSSVTYRIMATTEPLEHYDIQRKIRKELLLALNKANIKIPYPQLEVHNGK